ncbi:MAG: hypothetical protein D6788_00195 [Planctomycetota bacterium]|nr:MAG: hypothetical protein D6788_00195 [Planctomycetota bacterium]
MADRVVYAGRVRTVEWAVRRDKKIPGQKGWNRLNKEERTRLLARIKRIGDEEKVYNQEVFKKERGDIFAIKIFKVRIYCFFTSDNRLVLTHVVKKKRDKADPKELKRAEHIRRECINEE